MQIECYVFSVVASSCRVLPNGEAEVTRSKFKQIGTIRHNTEPSPL